MSTTKTNATLEAMLAQYENSSKPTTKSTEKKEYDLKNYFTTHLDEKLKTAIKTIRILPTKDGSSPFIEFWGHKAKVDKQNKVFACLKHEKGSDCPFCEANEELRATNKEQDKETAKKYSARKMYIVKLVSREAEKDGSFPVKFWRFAHDYRNQGILDKIFGVIQTIKKDITDPATGRDLSLVLARDQKGYAFVQSITQGDPSPLSEDAAQATEWLADERTWEDVYSVKPYDYLEIVVKGGTPKWDNDLKKFIDKSEATTETAPAAKLDEELSRGVANVKPNVTAAEPTTKTADVEVIDDTDDDLPF